MNSSPFKHSYSLLDSGEGLKLERIGDRTVARPASACIWKKRLSSGEWDKADASYNPDRGWSFSGGQFEDWVAEAEGFRLKLRLQQNGQIGFFPEHAGYLHRFNGVLSEAGAAPRMLNLFAYTGMASVYAAKNGAFVTHVDMNQKVLEWAAENRALNGLDEKNIRFINEDSPAFVKKEIKRGNKYDLIVLDPPSFSRTGKNKSWELENIAGELIGDCLSLLNRSGSAIIFTCHHPAVNQYAAANFARERTDVRVLDKADLLLYENGSERQIGCGSFMMARLS